jgi:hypothetical protein
MARKFLVSIDLNKNELQNAVIQNLATAPASPLAGQMYFDTVDGEIYYYTGTAWVSVQADAQVTYGTFSGRPAAGEAGRLYYATDQQLLYFDDGSTWAQVSNFGSVTAQTTYGASSGSGSSNNYARADHTHGTPSLTSTPPQALAIGGSSVVGVGTAPAREDHVHAMPSFGNVQAQTSFGAASANGSATTVARSDHDHGTPVHDNAAHSTINLSALAAPLADISLANYKITNLATPSADTDAANKGYVDATAQGLSVKEAAHIATAAILPNSPAWTSAGGGTITAGSNTTLTVDGDQVLVGQRVLVKNEAGVGGLGGEYNGIYELTQLGDGSNPWILVRTADANTSAEVKSGMFVFVQTGQTLADTGWVLTTNNPITLNTTVLTFTQFSGAGTYTASNGVQLVGNNFSGVVVSAGGLSVGASGFQLDTTIAVRKYAANVGDGTNTSYTITHNLGTQDVIVSVYDNTAPNAEVMTDVQHTSSSAITLVFATAPTSNQYRVVVHG